MKRGSALLLVLLPASAPADDDLAFFESKIRPLLAEHCYKCHSARASKVKGGLLLDSREGVQKGGDSGAVI
ncbi:MAG: c-type cytochrome domain-containing protein, partial [Verrucomicrobiota bacterium]|nr:c-type cytochrome domain-containing protein [Verrucomicrobiota bacterium]